MNSNNNRDPITAELVSNGKSLPITRSTLIGLVAVTAWLLFLLLLYHVGVFSKLVQWASERLLAM